MNFTFRMCVVLCAIAACKMTDDRPETLAYITETIFVPSCAAAECHSSMVRESGYAFDSVAAAQAAISGGGLIETCASPPCETADADSILIQIMTPVGYDGYRMPMDAPLANLDIELIANWIRDGADGYVPPAAPQ